MDAQRRMEDDTERNLATPQSTSTSHAVTPAADALPQDAALQCCFKYFFERHFTSEFCSFFYKPEFQKRHREFPFLIVSIVALTSRYMSFIEAETHFGMTPCEVGIVYGKKARQMARDTSDSPTVWNIQANLILALSELLSGPGASVKHWMYSGTAIRMAQAMRLNKNFHQIHSLREQEARRRVFWACFLWDKLLASSMFKPCILTEQSIQVALPGTDAAFAYGEASRGLTLSTLATFAGPPSDVGITPYLIVTVYLWSKIADWHIGDNRFLDKDAPTDPQSNFQKHHASMRAWISMLPAWLQWSERNYTVHRELSQERLFIILHLLHLSSMCVAHQAYLPHNKGPSLLLDTVDGAGLSLVHSDPALIAPCVVNAMATGEMIAWLMDNDPLAEQKLRSPWVGISLLSASAGLLWLQYNDSQRYNLSPNMAKQYLDDFGKLFEYWKSTWNVASQWLQILKGMEALYRVAYEGEITDDISRDEPFPDEPDESLGHEKMHQYYPRPGDGLPPVDPAAPLYTLLRDNTANAIHQNVAQRHWIWLQLAGTWPQSFSCELVLPSVIQDEEVSGLL
ncbi:hypothetical protein N7504_010976 [Penicillium tannophilum]|nr:hypothetical protein N7504_010976 [Penicillium tannophilum]